MHYSFKISKINCPSCTSLLIQSLEQIDYIKEVTINYDEQKLLIEGVRKLTEDELKVTIATIIKSSSCPKHKHQKITRKKFVVKELSTNAKILLNTKNQVTDEYFFENIDCAACAMKVEKAINKIEGVIDAHVNFINKKIIIVHNKNVSVYDSIVERVRKIESDAIIYKEHVKVKKPKKLSTALFIASVILFIPLAIYFYITGDISWYMYASFGLIYLLIGHKIIRDSLKNIIHGEIFDENLLMLIASVGAFIISEPCEAILVIVLFRVGEAIENKAIDSSTKSIEGLINLKVENVTLASGEIKKIEEVKVGDEFIVKVGEMISLDGVVVDGETSLDMKSLTGEMVPVFVKENSEVLSGSINLEKVIRVKATKVSSESTMEKVVKLIEDASNKKSKTEMFIRKFARVYTPLILVLALISGFVMYFAMNKEITDTLHTVFVFLVVSCPCALVISVPLGFFTGLGKASSYGILVKGGNFLEAINNAKTFVFDKTGTITEGNFEVESIKCFNDFSYDEVIKTVAHVESFSTHPIALALKHAYKGKIDQSKVKELKEEGGYGIKAKVFEKEVLVGNANLLQKENIDLCEALEKGTIVYCAVEKKLAGYIVIVDEIKPRAKETIKYLNCQNKETIMLSGDKKDVVEIVKNKVAIKEAYSQLLPDEKLTLLQEKIKEDDNVVYVGDGINDTPCIKLAKVGIAMGKKGSDIAKSAADIVIMNDDIGKIKDLIRIAKKTHKIVKENIILALSVKLIILVLSFFDVFKSFSMLIGVLSDVGLCLIAICNTLRINSLK